MTSPGPTSPDPAPVPPGRRITAVVVLTAGNVAVAASAFVLLAAGPRVMGRQDFSALALAWTLSTLFGLGLGNPTEQVVTRRLSAGEGSATRPFRPFVGAAIGSVLLILLFGGSLPAARGSSGFVLAAVTAVLGWVLATWVRGRLAGGGHLTRYAVVLFVEAGVRTVLVGAALAGLAWGGTAWGGTALLAAVGVPLVLAGCVGLLLRRPLAASRTEPSSGQAGEHGYFGVVSVAYQACLNAPALILDWQLGAQRPALVGAFVAVSAVLRAPSLLFGGLATQALVGLSRSWADGDRDAFVSGTRTLGAHWAALAVPSTGLVLLLSPWLLPLYYGSPIDLSPAVVVALGVSTLLATGAAVGGGPLFAAARGRTAAGAWAAGAVVTLAVVTASGGSTPWLVAGLVGGPLVAAAIVLRGLAHTVRDARPRA